jgi:hypothetical protein
LVADRAEQLAKDQDHAGVDPAKQGGQQAIDQGAVDQPVNVVQPVTQDGHADGGRDRPQGEVGRCGPPSSKPRTLDHRRQHDHAGGVGQPLQLLALDPLGPTESHDQRGGGSNQDDGHAEAEQLGQVAF